MPISPGQKAFSSGDWLYANTILLRILVGHRQGTYKSVYLAFIDVFKVFDCVSRQSMLLALYWLGICTSDLVQ